MANLYTGFPNANMKLALINRSVGRTNVVIDVVGFYAYGTNPVSPGLGVFGSLLPSTRVLDTRTTQRIPAGGSVTVPVTNPVDPRLGTAVVNLTVVNAAGPGHLTADAADRTSLVNYDAGATVANTAYVPITDGATVTFYNKSTGSIDLLVDVAGSFIGNDVPPADGVPLYDGRFVSVPVTRIVDTRIALGSAGAVGYDGSITVNLSALPVGATAVVVNLTSTEAAAPGSLTAYATGTAEPMTSNVNYAFGRSVANLAVVPVGADRSITLHSHSIGAVHLIVDIAGYYLGA